MSNQRLLDIPKDLLANLFPDENLCLTDFAKFPVPATASKTLHPIPASRYLSTKEPNAGAKTTYTTLLCPPDSIAEELAKSIIIAGSKARSICCPHIPSARGTRYPLWIVRYWLEVPLLRLRRTPWAKADLSMQRRSHSRTEGFSHSVTLIDDVYRALASMPWSGIIQGFEEDEDISYLAKYATKDWLSTAHENQLLDLLRRDVIQHGLASSIEVETAYFGLKVIEAHKNRETYDTSKSFKAPRALGQALASGERDKLAFIANEGEVHWFAVVIDFIQGEIWHGDSMGGRMSKEWREALEWWTWVHTGVNFAIKNMPVTIQDDGWSCGLLAWNALDHFIFGRLHPLIDASAVADERLRVLLRIIARHHDQVRQSINLPAPNHLIIHHELVFPHRKQRLQVHIPHGAP